ncbi:MAG: glycosyltransferase [Cyanobacteria bacterium P01_F01_bin.13]
MAHIVCITGGLTGILNSSLGLVQQLQQAGHRVTYASPADLREPVTAQSITYVQMERWVMQLGEPTMAWWTKVRLLPERQQRAVDALGVQNFVETMRALSPDLLLLDIEMHPHIMAAAMAQLPVALLCPFLSIWKQPNLPPIHTKTIPGKGWRGHRWGIEWSWLRYGWTKWQEFQQERRRRVGLDWISVLRCYARQIGYPLRLRFGFRQWLVPYPDDRLPILCMNALELDFPHQPHPSMHYIGPMVADNHRKPSAMGQSLDRIVEHRKSSDKPLIYCGLSSLAKADKQFIQQIIEAAASSPHWDWVLGLGGKLEPGDLGDLPKNVYALRWAPQRQVLHHADCAIISSGINSINECISHGVPMLVYSLRCADQNGNAARVTYHRLGIVGDRNHNSAALVCKHVQALLTHGEYRVNVGQMQEYFQKYAQENRAVEIIKTLLKEQEAYLVEVGSP